MNLIKQYLEWKESPNRTPITFKNILGYIQAYLRKWFKPVIPVYIQEQYNYRLKIANTECLAKGTCINCGCAVPDKFWEDKECICYPEMMDKDNWKQYKKNLKREQNDTRKS